MYQKVTHQSANIMVSTCGNVSNNIANADCQKSARKSIIMAYRSIKYRYVYNI